MKAAEKFVEETSTAKENFDESLFVEFMRKVSIWGFYCISKQVYLAMSEKEKREKISKYYSDMKSRHVPVGEFFYLFVSFFYFLILQQCLSLLRIIREFLEVILIDYFFQMELQD